MKAWIGVDLDGTLAEYDGFKGPGVIGAPITQMVGRVKAWLADGKDVRIFTARVWEPGLTDPMPQREYWARREEARVAREAIGKWCEEHIGCELQVTCQKDYGMVMLYDDRAKQVIPNTGILLEDVLDRVTKNLLVNNYGG